MRFHFGYHFAKSVKSAHQRVGRQPPDDVPEGGNRGRKITGHAGREPAKVNEMPTIRCPWCSTLNAKAEAFLGALGVRRWFRCRYCGGDFSTGGK